MEYPLQDWMRTATFAAPGHILVATSITDLPHLVPHAIAQAKSICAHLTLVHATFPFENVTLEAGAIPLMDKGQIETEARLLMSDVAHNIAEQGVPCDVAVRRGFIVDVLGEEINRTGAGRLIIGSRGLGTLGRFELGSVAEELFAISKIPIFAVGPSAKAPTCHVTPRKILHPVSLKGCYQETVRLAISIAEIYKAELILLHVLNDRSMHEVDDSAPSAMVKDAITNLLPNGSQLAARPAALVRHGNTAEEILKVAISLNVDWILLGTNADSAQWFSHNCIAYRVVTSTTCPVLALRHHLPPDPLRYVQNSENTHLASLAK